MSSSTQAAAPAPQARGGMSVFERYLTLWVFLCIVLGVALGQFIPALFQSIGHLEVVRVVNQSKDWYDAGASRG